VRLKLIGRHNVANALAASAAGIALGADLEPIAQALEGVVSVPGRLQRVPAGAPFDVLVDYAHTDDALANVLSALRPLARGRVILVFGCGGDRDRTKRPRMARVAETWADAVIVTSDNPRGEDPLAIIAEILAGFSGPGRQKVQVEADRRSAIAAALEQAGPGDVVLIAGKGHENYQIIGHERRHFDDAETAGELLRRRWPGRKASACDG
jgi:UDP-N-acetylmuramoyl-L-alanyl-D-glutamate--2,6-diaminopimelate ligase